MRDLVNNIEPRRGLSPVAVAQTNNDPLVSEIIDMRGFKSCVFLILTGNMVDAAFTTVALMEDGDDSGLSDNTAVIDAQLDPTELVLAFDEADDNQVRKIGYVGEKRYVRLTITPSDNTGDLPIAMCVIMGDPDERATVAQAT